MSYIYITGWDKFQHYKNRRPPWIKMYVDLLANDDWVALTPADAKLLQGLWMLAAMYGNGRLKAGKGQERSLTVQLGARKGSLERLEQAGFIEVRASKALADLPPQSKRTETDIPLTPASGGTVNHLKAVEDAPRRQTRAERQAEEAAQKRIKAVVACRRVWRNAEEDGENMDALHESLLRDYRHDVGIVAEATGRASAA